MADDTFPYCVTLDLDCAAVCRLAAATMAGDGGFAQRFGAMCDQICRQCGEECDPPGMDSVCPHCAQARSGMETTDEMEMDARAAELFSA